MLKVDIRIYIYVNSPTANIEKKSIIRTVVANKYLQ